ncbi:MAG: glycogen synthase GlgA [Clostridia bacterium]|nr:glycogen synthase GlgA [Clostridia bacterium]
MSVKRNKSVIGNKTSVAQKTKKQAEEKTPAAPITVTVERKPSILFVASEGTPFIKTGGLADVIGSLPLSLAERGNYDIRVIMPLYAGMEDGYKNHLTYVGNFNVPVGWRNQYCGLFYYKRKNVTFYFIDNEYYFKRDNLYGYFDDGERFAFFSRAVLESLIQLDYYPTVLHCHDWQSALSVIYLKTIYANRWGFDKIRAVFTIHNIEYQGKYSPDLICELFGLPAETLPLIEYSGAINLMKGAMQLSDYVTTVSRTYAEEIKTPQYASGLEYAVNDCANKLVGILNGIDDKVFDPETDKALFKNYSANDFSGKKICKQELQKMLSLPVRDDVPVIAMITRLVSHKGLDLVKYVFEELLKEDVQVIILGKGDVYYENYFAHMSDLYRGKVRAIIAYNKDLSSKIYSGADLFLMPSKSEPCGLSQMIACRYGTVPIVRTTGGLNDTITPYNVARYGGNGFCFNAYNADEMLYVIKDAIFTYGNKPVFDGIKERAAKTDFSWLQSAGEYEKLYNLLKN